jgi:hypothetical protein
MARLAITAQHRLSKEEVLRRLKERLGSIPQYRLQISHPYEEWDHDVLAFRFTALGMKVSGTLTVNDRDVRMAAEVPFAAMLFKKKIDGSVRAELDALLR